MKLECLTPKITENLGTVNGTYAELTMNENGNVEENQINTSSENVEENFEIHTLTQEAVNEQIKRFIAPLTRQLGEMARLVQGMVTTPHPSQYPRTDNSTFSGKATHQSDNFHLGNYM